MPLPASEENVPAAPNLLWLPCVASTASNTAPSFSIIPYFMWDWAYFVNSSISRRISTHNSIWILYNR